MLFRSNDTATTEIYTVTNTLSLHDALPIYVFNMDDERNIDRIVSGERVGTVVST